MNMELILEARELAARLIPDFEIATVNSHRAGRLLSRIADALEASDAGREIERTALANALKILADAEQTLVELKPADAPTEGVWFSVGELKMARETFCVAAHAIATLYPAALRHTTRLQRIIDQIDVHRPLGPDGKHRNRHTETCGCEDKRRIRWCNNCDHPPGSPDCGLTDRADSE